MSAVSFGDFVLDTDARELRRGGQPVLLTPKAYQLLEVLVRHSPKALSKSATAGAALARYVRGREESRQSDRRDPRSARRRRHASAVRPDRAPVRLRVPGPGCGAACERGHCAADVRFRLVWAGGRVGLADGEHVLGRDPDLELFLDSPDVSRHHARIRIAGDEATIEDLDSKNGTFVTDRRLDAAARLVDGDSIRIGSVRLTFSAVRSRGSTETQSPAGGEPGAWLRGSIIA